MRVVLLRERITVVHAHQAFSCLCHEAILHARTMGYKARPLAVFSRRIPRASGVTGSPLAS